MEPFCASSPCSTMSPTIAIRLADAGDAFLARLQSASPLPSSSYIFERYRKASPSAHSPNPRWRRWARRTSPTRIDCLKSPGRRGLNEELAILCPDNVLLIAPAKAWPTLDSSIVKDAEDIADTIVQGKYKATLLLDGTLPMEECEELKTRLNAAQAFQGVAARQLFAAHLRTAIRPGVDDDTETSPPVWTGSLTIRGSDHCMSGLELFDPSRKKSQHHGVERLQATHGVVVQSAPRVPECGAMLAACGTLELRLGIGCDSTAAKFVDEWISLGSALRLEIGTVQFWCFWTQENGNWCCRALRVPEMTSTMIDALDVARFRRQDLGFECSERKLVPEILGRLPDIRVEKLSRQNTVEIIARQDDAEKERDAAEALALLEETRDCIIEAAPLDSKKRVVADALPALEKGLELEFATPMQESQKDRMPCKVLDPRPRKFSWTTVHPAKSAAERKADMAGPLAAKKRIRPVDDAEERKADMAGPLAAKKRTRPVDDADERKAGMTGPLAAKKMTRPIDDADGSVLSASTMKTNTTSLAGLSPGGQREWKRRRFERLQGKGSAQVRSTKKRTAAPVQNTRLRVNNLEKRNRRRAADAQKLKHSRRTYVEEVTKRVLDSLEDAPPFFDHDRCGRLAEGDCPKDMQFHCIGDKNETLRHDLAAGKGKFPIPGTHGIEYYREGDNRDKKVMRLEQYLGKLGVEFASTQGKVTRKQAEKLEQEVGRLEEDGIKRRKQGKSHSHREHDIPDGEESTDFCPDDGVTPLSPLPVLATQDTAAGTETAQASILERHVSGPVMKHSNAKYGEKTIQEVSNASLAEVKHSKAASIELERRPRKQADGKEPATIFDRSLKDELLALIEHSAEKDALERCEALTDVLTTEVKLLGKEKRKALMHRVVDALS